MGKKRKRTILVFVWVVFYGVEESEDYLQAVETLKHQRDNGLLLVQTELRLRLQNAKELALFEESRINQLFNVGMIWVIHGRSKLKI